MFNLFNDFSSHCDITYPDTDSRSPIRDDSPDIWIHYPSSESDNNDD